MRRLLGVSLMIIVVIVVLAGAAIAYERLGFGEPPAPVPAPAAPIIAAPEPEPVAWDGRGQQRVGATFLVSGHQITIERFVYGALNTKRANVGVDMTVISGTNSRAWLNRAWVLNSPNRRWLPARTTITRRGTINRVRLSFVGIPSAQLRGGMAFAVTYPDGEGGRESFSIAPLAPKAPASPEVTASP